MFKIQLRGHCQRCGRQQAVKNGTMAKHGYRVRNGWFEGACSGHSFEPIERSRKTLDKTVEAIRAQCADLRQQADSIESGNLPATFMYAPTASMKKVETAIADIPAYALPAIVRSYVWGLRHRAERGEHFCDHLTATADRYHGKELIEIRK